MDVKSTVRRFLNGDVVRDPNGLEGVVETVNGREAVVAYGLRRPIRLTWPITSLTLNETYCRLGRRSD